MSDPIITETITVAVWWPGEGYGGATLCQDMGHAESAARELERLGYGKDRYGEIHVIRTRREATLWPVGGGND